MENIVIALAGKGGVGKTSLSAAIVGRLLAARPEARILAIDADPAVGLETALGVHAEHTIDEIRGEIADAGEGDREKKRALELLGESRMRVLDAMVEDRGFAFIAIGRPEAAGCYCSVNDYLREVIAGLADQFDYVVIDGEAGVEQINRRVMEKVSHLVLVTDPSKKGTQVIKTIKKVADELTMYKKIGVVINRVTDPSIKGQIDTGDIPVLACIENDASLASFDVQGRSVLNLPENANVVKGAEEILKALGVL